MATRKKVTVKTKAKARPAAKNILKKILNLKSTKPAADSNGLPKPSTKPWGQAGKAL